MNKHRLHGQTMLRSERPAEPSWATSPALLFEYCYGLFLRCLPDFETYVARQMRGLQSFKKLGGQVNDIKERYEVQDFTRHTLVCFLDEVIMDVPFTWHITVEQYDRQELELRFNLAVCPDRREVKVLDEWLDEHYKDAYDRENYLNKDVVDMTRAFSEFLEWCIAIDSKLLFTKHERYL